jgi:hypothetical protein
MALDMKKEQTAGMAAALNRMLTTLEQKVNPAHAALIVVDVQNDFCAKDGSVPFELTSLIYPSIIPAWLLSALR